MLKILALLPHLAAIANALEDVIKTQFSQGIELRPTIKGVPLRINIERAVMTGVPVEVKEFLAVLSAQ